MADERKVSSITHPDYDANLPDWVKFRDTYEAGHPFVDKYLVQFSDRETGTEFIARKRTSYAPAHAKAAVNEIKNAIFQRTADIIRLGGPQSYIDAVTTTDSSGVDLKGRDMNTFIGTQLLPELLSMGKVGVFVDMPRLDESSPSPNLTVQDTIDQRPYLYMFKAEDILSWNYSQVDQKLNNLLLKEHCFTADEQYGLPSMKSVRYRWIFKIDEKVGFVMFDNEGTETSHGILGISEIPFVISQISASLLVDVADYQIALLNLGSSDIAYATKANFPFYTEQQDLRSSSPWMKGTSPPDDGTTTANNGEAADVRTNADAEINVGTTTGRKYGKGLDRPGFINPSGEPLRVSMEKQKELREEIRLLVNLSVQSLTPTKMQSSDSKDHDERSLEAGLSYIGLALLHSEQQIAEFWAMYESEGSASTIKYPKHYSLRTTESELKEADSLIKLQSKAPSDTYRKEIAKRVAKLLLSRHVPFETLSKVEKEIDAAEVTLVDPDILEMISEKGAIDLKRLAKAFGIPPAAVDDAAIEHEDRLKRISEAQATASGTDAEESGPTDRVRGVDDTDPEPKKSDKDEKKKSQGAKDDEENPKKKVRGNAKVNRDS